jgi:hypothetical protein
MTAAMLTALVPAAHAGPALASIWDPYEGDVSACLRQAEDAMDRLGILVTLRFPGAIQGETADVSYFVTCSLPGFVIYSVSSVSLNIATNTRLLNQYRAAF